MTKNSGMKTAILLFVVMVLFSGAAYADTFPNFRLRIEDTSNGPGTGAGVVITDDAVGLDEDVADAGVIFYTEAIGNFFVHVTVAYTEPDGVAGARLSLSSVVSRIDNSPGQIRITLEDTGYIQTVPPTALFTGILAGSDVENNPLDKAQLFDGVNWARFQTWVNTANEAPLLGSDGIYAGGMSPSSVAIPVGSLAVFPGFNAGQAFAGADIASTNSGGVTIVGPYSIHSQATIDFSGSGMASFGLAGEVRAGETGPPLAATPVPEPASLLLLGSSMVGLGLMRRKLGRAA